MERDWREAWVRGDAAALDRIHADDYLVINYLGQVNTKAQVMADVRADAFKNQSMEHKDVVMRVYDNVVIVNARTVNKGHRQERDVSGEFSYTRVYVKRDGRWQAVLSHSTSGDAVTSSIRIDTAIVNAVVRLTVSSTCQNRRDSQAQRRCQADTGPFSKAAGTGLGDGMESGARDSLPPGRCWGSFYRLT